jgi:hypothetical protein
MNSKILNSAMLLAGLLGAGLAQAQSHSVVNYSNPPNTQADSKAATDATPGLSATAGRQDANHTDQNVPSGKIRKAKPVKKVKHSAKTGKPTENNEQAMQKDPSEADANAAQKHAFDETPVKR